MKNYLQSSERVRFSQPTVMFFGSEYRPKICVYQSPNSGEGIIRLWVIWPRCTRSIFKCCNMNYCPRPFFYSWNGLRGLMYYNTFSCHRSCSSWKCDLLTSYMRFGYITAVSVLWHALHWEKLPNKLRWDRRWRNCLKDRGALGGVGRCFFSSPRPCHTDEVISWPSISYQKESYHLWLKDFLQLHALCTEGLTDQHVRCQWL